MVVYRITKENRAGDLSGEGAKKFGGRWNEKGVPVLYTSGSRALAALESLVHLDSMALLSKFTLTEILVPDDLQVKVIEQKELNSGTLRDFEKLKKIGMDWVRKMEFPVLKVPSVVIPEEFNLLVNPQHILSRRVKLIKYRVFDFDARLI